MRASAGQEVQAVRVVVLYALEVLDAIPPEPPLRVQAKRNRPPPQKTRGAASHELPQSAPCAAASPGTAYRSARSFSAWDIFSTAITRVASLPAPVAVP